MKVTCPKDPSHKSFNVTAHVTEDWVVDEQGNFVEISPDNDPQVVHEPDSGDYYTCKECGTDAKAERD